mmetsp:Transcript_15349/g.41200  ORF Transcript_15349/g.41200 Transcript_15349/m.41200 type:complete len:312 (+) Transcript_15349:58-993(+)
MRAVGAGESGEWRRSGAKVGRDGGAAGVALGTASVSATAAAAAAVLARVLESAARKVRAALMGVALAAAVLAVGAAARVPALRATPAGAAVVAAAVAEAKRSQMNLTLIGTVCGGVALLLLKFVRARQEQRRAAAVNPEDIVVERYDVKMEKQWKAEDQQKKASAAKEATDDQFMTQLRSRMQEVNAGKSDVDAPVLEGDGSAETFEMKDVIDSLEKMWTGEDGEDSPGAKGGKGPKRGRDGDNSDDIRMGTWGGTGQALLEPPGGTSNGPADESVEGPDAPPPSRADEPPKVSSDTLKMLRKCWDASDSQ